MTNDDSGREPGSESADVSVTRGAIVVKRATGRLELAADGLRMLPAVFVDAYQTLWEAGLEGLRGTQSASHTDMYVPPRVRRVRTSTGQISTRGLAARAKGVSGDPNWLKSERMLEARRGVDRKLRKLAREISITLNGSDEEVRPRRCSVCKKWGEGEWLYCPRDGKPMEEIDR